MRVRRIARRRARWLRACWPRASRPEPAPPPALDSAAGAVALAEAARVLLCPFHHLIAIHRWGWTITMHPDGTTTATSPDQQKTFHSHGPPGPLPKVA